MALLVQFRVVVEAEPEGAQQDVFRVDGPVRFGDQHAVQAPGRRLGRGPVVFRRLGDAFDLLRGEPFRQPRIFPDDPGGDIVVVLPSFAQPGIVEGGRREDDFRVGFRIGFRQVKRLPDDLAGVPFPVCGIEGGIAGNDLLTDIPVEFRADARRDGEGKYGPAHRTPAMVMMSAKTPAAVTPAPAP